MSRRGRRAPTPRALPASDPFAGIPPELHDDVRRALAVARRRLLRTGGRGRDPYSAATALCHVPRLFRVVEREFRWDRGTLNADVGGGPCELATEWLAGRGVESHVIDPGHRSEAHNRRAVARCYGRADTVTLSCVLNVLRTAAQRRHVLRGCRAMLAPHGLLYVSVNEGDADGRGRETMYGWQAHAPIGAYEREVRAVFPNVLRRERILVAAL